MRLLRMEALLLAFGVALGDFEDGVELAAVGVDPLRLFEVFELSVKVPSEVDLHYFLIDACQLLHQVHKLPDFALALLCVAG